LKVSLYAFAVLCLSATTGNAQKLVDPGNVAPEYREAAEKRRAEQIKQQECARKADTEKISRRDRTAFVIHCLESAGN
jgi:hypothetical protein